MSFAEAESDLYSQSCFEGPWARVQGGLGWAILALTGAVVLVQGGNQPVAWTMMAALVLLLGAAQLALHLVRNPARALRIALPLAVIYSCVVSWAVLQAVWPAPPELAHPAWAAAPEGAVPRISADPGQGVHIALRLATYGLIAWIMAAASLSNDRAWAYLRAIGIFSGAYASYGIAAGLSGTNPLLGLDAGGQTHITASFVNRNHFATYAGFGMLVNVALYLHTTQPSDETKGLNALRNGLETFFSGAWIHALNALLCGAAVSLSLSRAGGVAAVVGLAVLLGAQRWRGAGGAIACGVVVALLFGVGAFSLGTGTFNRILAGGESSAFRFVVYATLIDLIPQRPWLGQGLGAFEDTFRAHVPLEVSRLEWGNAHSSYLGNAYEMGLPAAAAFYFVLCMVGARLLTGLFVRRTDRTAPALALSVFTLAAAHATVDFSLEIPGVAALFAVLMGLGWAQSFTRSDRASRAPIEQANRN